MKKFLLILLALTMCVSMCACGESREEKISDALESKSWTLTTTLDNKNNGKSSRITHTYRFEDGFAYVEVVRETDDPILSLLGLYSAYFGPYTIDENKTIFITVAGEKESRNEEYTLLDKPETRNIYYRFEGNGLDLYLDEDLTKEFH